MKAPEYPQLAARIHDWRRLRPELFWIYEGAVKTRHLHLNRDVRPGIPVFLIRTGGLRLETRRRELEVGEGKWVVIPEEMLRRDFAPGTEVVSIRFDIYQGDGTSALKGYTTRVFGHRDYPELLDQSNRVLASTREVAHKEYLSLAGHWSDLETYFCIRESFFGWLRCLLSIFSRLGAEVHAPRQLDDRVQRVVDFLDARPLTDGPAEADLARIAGLSPSQLIRLFRRDLAQTPMQYWDQRRLNAALSRLAGSMMPIKQIALELGFGSQNYFARWIRAQTQLAPSEYRQRFNPAWRR